MDVTGPDVHVFGNADAQVLDYVRSEPDMTLWAYGPLMRGAYARPDRQVHPAHHPVYDHPGTPERRAALREVAAETGATPNQVVPAWLMGGDPPVIPIVGVSSVAQLDEVLGAAGLELDAALRRRLDEAGRCEM